MNENLNRFLKGIESFMEEESDVYLHEVDKLIEIIRVQVKIVDNAASWWEGKEVDNGFDNPSAAKDARKAQADIEKIINGINDEIKS